MSIKADLLEKKKQLEFTIKMAMQKFMDETGLTIERIHATIQTCPMDKFTTQEDIVKMEMKSVIDSLDIKVKL